MGSKAEETATGTLRPGGPFVDQSHHRMDGRERLLAPEGPGAGSAGRREEAGDGHFNWQVEEDSLAREGHPQDERDPGRSRGKMPPESILSLTY